MYVIDKEELPPVDSGYEPYELVAKDLENENRTAQKVNWPVLIQTEWLAALLKLLQGSQSNNVEK